MKNSMVKCLMHWFSLKGVMMDPQYLENMIADSRRESLLRALREMEIVYEEVDLEKCRWRHLLLAAGDRWLLVVGGFFHYCLYYDEGLAITRKSKLLDQASGPGIALSYLGHFPAFKKPRLKRALRRAYSCAFMISLMSGHLFIAVIIYQGLGMLIRRHFLKKGCYRDAIKIKHQSFMGLGMLGLTVLLDVRQVLLMLLSLQQFVYCEKQYHALKITGSMPLEKENQEDITSIGFAHCRFSESTMITGTSMQLKRFYEQFHQHDWLINGIQKTVVMANTRDLYYAESMICDSEDAVLDHFQDSLDFLLEILEALDEFGRCLYLKNRFCQLDQETNELFTYLDWFIHQKGFVICPDAFGHCSKDLIRKCLLILPDARMKMIFSLPGMNHETFYDIIPVFQTGGHHEYRMDQ